jgi:hypothetical protein
MQLPNNKQWKTIPVDNIRPLLIALPKLRPRRNSKRTGAGKL